MVYGAAMRAAINAFLLVYAGLFPIVNPVGSAPIFLALTSRNSAVVRHGLVRRVAINSFILLAGSLFVGAHVLVFFGITLPVVRIAGGLAVASFGWRLLRDGVEPAQSASHVDESGPIDAFYPLTMPLTVGRGRSRWRSRSARSDRKAWTISWASRWSAAQPFLGWRRSR